LILPRFVTQERGVVHTVNFRGQLTQRIYLDPVANTTCWHRFKHARTVRNNRNLQIFPKKYQSVAYEFLGGNDIENNLYFLDSSQLRAHLYELWHEYKHNSYQNYDQSDSNYLVDEKKWLHNLRRLEVLVQNYAFEDFSLDIPFAFKTLGVLPNSKSKYMYWTIGQKTSKSQQDCDVWDTFQSIILPNISIPYITKNPIDSSYILGFESILTRK
jgi:hypothetical protein